MSFQFFFNALVALSALLLISAENNGTIADGKPLLAIVILWILVAVELSTVLIQATWIWSLLGFQLLTILPNVPLRKIKFLLILLWVINTVIQMSVKLVLDLGQEQFQSTATLAWLTTRPSEARRTLIGIAPSLWNGNWTIFMKWFHVYLLCGVSSLPLCWMKTASCGV